MYLSEIHTFISFLRLCIKQNVFTYFFTRGQSCYLTPSANIERKISKLNHEQSKWFEM